MTARNNHERDAVATSAPPERDGNHARCAFMRAQRVFDARRAMVPATKVGIDARD
ncbi:hypothetical protein [Lysobacter capsici]|uniref:hypothetical protein n=1 Tax=Lysobacter capsici TaxID=435897 RepID=UPI001C007DF1|nr:hypothetical protein [Lysobacter capsici]QWF17399.1 hypothetical protein KME82_00915 [Lysobacter capsici]